MGKEHLDAMLERSGGLLDRRREDLTGAGLEREGDDGMSEESSRSGSESESEEEEQEVGSEQEEAEAASGYGGEEEEEEGEEEDDDQGPSHLDSCFSPISR